MYASGQPLELDELEVLPPAAGEVHKDTSQALFGLSITPEDAAKQLEQSVKDYYKK